jgi:hypothetical protein
VITASVLSAMAAARAARSGDGLSPPSRVRTVRFRGPHYDRDPLLRRLELPDSELFGSPTLEPVDELLDRLELLRPDELFEALRRLPLSELAAFERAAAAAAAPAAVAVVTVAAAAAAAAAVRLALLLDLAVRDGAAPLALGLLVHDGVGLEAVEVGPDGALDVAHAAGRLLDQAGGLDVDADLDARQARGDFVEGRDAVVRDALSDCHSIRTSGRRFSISAMNSRERSQFSSRTVRPVARGFPQADGTIRGEPHMDVADVAAAVRYMADLPPEANVLTLTVMATGMPYVGRG